jgi:hypothetical protein
MLPGHRFPFPARGKRSLDRFLHFILASHVKCTDYAVFAMGYNAFGSSAGIYFAAADNQRYFNLTLSKPGKVFLKFIPFLASGRIC